MKFLLDTDHISILQKQWTLPMRRVTPRNDCEAQSPNAVSRPGSL